MASFCPHCGAALTGSGQFCGKCGYDLNQSASTQPVQPVPGSVDAQPQAKPASKSRVRRGCTGCLAIIAVSIIVAAVAAFLSGGGDDAKTPTAVAIQPTSVATSGQSVISPAPTEDEDAKTPTAVAIQPTSVATSSQSVISPAPTAVAIQPTSVATSGQNVISPAPTEEALIDRVTKADRAPITTVEKNDVSFAGRERWSYRIIVEDADNYSMDELLGTLLTAVEMVKSEHPGVEAINIFAYRPGTDTEGLFSLARLFTSTDGKGWDGNGGDAISGEGDDKSLVWIEIYPEYDYEIDFPKGDAELYGLPQLSDLE